MTLRGKADRSTSSAVGKSTGRSKRSRAAHTNRKKPAVDELPDLEPVYNDIYDAYAVVGAASFALHEGDSEVEGLALATLRQGTKALNAAVDRLEKVEAQVGRIRRKVTGES